MSNKQSTDPVQLLVIALFAFCAIYAVVTQISEIGSRNKVDNSNWIDPGSTKSSTTDWPYYGKTTSELIKELENTFMDKGVTPTTEQELYNQIGGMYPGSRQGPKYYDYDFLEVPISMTILNKDGQRYYLSFQKGGVKKGDPRLNN